MASIVWLSNLPASFFDRLPKDSNEFLFGEVHGLTSNLMSKGVIGDHDPRTVIWDAIDDPVKKIPLGNSNKKTRVIKQRVHTSL